MGDKYNSFWEYFSDSWIPFLLTLPVAALHFIACLVLFIFPVIIGSILVSPHAPILIIPVLVVELLWVVVLIAYAVYRSQYGETEVWYDVWDSP